MAEANAPGNVERVGVEGWEDILAHHFEDKIKCPECDAWFSAGDVGRSDTDDTECPTCGNSILTLLPRLPETYIPFAPSTITLAKLSTCNATAREIPNEVWKQVVSYLVQDTFYGPGGALYGLGEDRSVSDYWQVLCSLSFNGHRAVFITATIALRNELQNWRKWPAPENLLSVKERYIQVLERLLEQLNQPENYMLNPDAVNINIDADADAGADAIEDDGGEDDLESEEDLHVDEDPLTDFQANVDEEMERIRQLELQIQEEQRRIQEEQRRTAEAAIHIRMLEVLGRGFSEMNQTMREMMRSRERIRFRERFGGSFRTE